MVSNGAVVAIVVICAVAGTALIAGVANMYGVDRKGTEQNLYRPSDEQWRYMKEVRDGNLKAMSRPRRHY